MTCNSLNEMITMQSRIVLVLSLIFIQHLAQIFAQTAQRPELIVQTGHTRPVYSVAFSPNGQLIASASEDNTIKLWKVDTGQELKTFFGHSFTVYWVGFSPNGKWLASGSADKTVKIWDVKTGQELKTLVGNTDDINSVAFSPDNKLIAAGDEDGNIKVWNISTGKELKTLKGHSESVRDVVFSPNGKLLASASQDKSIKLWNVSTGKVIKTLLGHTDYVFSIKFSKPGNTLLSCSWDNTAKLWNIFTGRELKTYKINIGKIYSADFSPNGNRFAVGGEKGIATLNITLKDKSSIFSSTYSKVNDIKFSPDGKILALANEENTITLLNAETGKTINKLGGNIQLIDSVEISPNRQTLAYKTVSEGGMKLNIWDLNSGQKLMMIPTSREDSVEFSPDGKSFILREWKDKDLAVKLWNLQTQRVVNLKQGYQAAFSSDNKILASACEDKVICLYDVMTGNLIKKLEGHTSYIYRLISLSDGNTLVSTDEETIHFWNLETGKQENIMTGQSSIAFSSDRKLFATVTKVKVINIWDLSSRTLIKQIPTSYDSPIEIAFSPDGKILATVGQLLNYKEGNSDFRLEINLWDIERSQLIKSFTQDGLFDSGSKLFFSSDGKTLVVESADESVDIFNYNFWDISSGQQIKEIHKWYDLSSEDLNTESIIKTVYPDFFKSSIMDVQVFKATRNTVNFYEGESGELLVSLILIDENNFVVAAPDGRFDTTQLDNTRGVHWLTSDTPFKPVPFEIFMRNYFEPRLLPRILNCTLENNCDKQFKPLPSIAKINRLQPKIKFLDIKPDSNLPESVDITIEIESALNEVNLAVGDKPKKQQFSSGAYDLRLFCDGQLVGVSTPKGRLEAYIADAPRLVAETRASGKLIDTAEDRAWREANDIFTLKADNVKFVAPNRAQYTFRNIKLPRDGRKEVAFTAYAFNADKVKSATTEPFKFTIPNAIANTPRKGRAIVISIGVNASETLAYNLRYAANDARKMQEIIGARLRADSDKYAEVIQIPLVSDYDAGGSLAENTAQKAIIKGVFSLLAGNEKEVPSEVFKQIPNRDRIKAVEPEDTLIITYAGHGYADQAGIFYLLPYDIGKDTRQLNAENLRKTISSDELSLWMQDITAAEMIMVIDACHSSAAVQGDGFKPGPMGSRGLGQLAYDKDMKILSATQANNVALELNSLEQGLLSYALLQDGIVKGQADADQDKQLLTTEWLTFAERRVPELYQEVRDGKRGIMVNGRSLQFTDSRAKIVTVSGKQRSSLNLQQPSVFDFKRRNVKTSLFALP